MPSFRTTDDRSRAVNRVMRKIHDALVKAYALRVETDKIDQGKLAEKLGIDKAVVSRRLSGAANLTERTLGEMCWALGHELVLQVVPFEELRKGNVMPLAERGSAAVSVISAKPPITSGSPSVGAKFIMPTDYEKTAS